MNKFSKIADGLGGWLTFEQRCGRYPLFCESYLAYPLGQLLQHRFPGRILSEIDHPILSSGRESPGRKPRIDFVVTGNDRRFDLVVETKWVSKSPTLIRDIVKDIVRLDLLLPILAKETLLILAGNVRDLRRLLQDPILQPQKGKPLLVREDYFKSAVHFFYRLSELRRGFYSKVLKVFDGVEISSTIQLERSGPFPRQTKTDQYQVYLWRILPRGNKFKAEEYESRSLQHLKNPRPLNRSLQPTARKHGG
jgi:hypothetical protein